MSEPVCDRCGAALPPEANFCPGCGARVGRGFTRAQVMTAAVLGLEVVAMLAVSLFVVPRLAAVVKEYGGPRSTWTRTVFAPWWMPAWTSIVAALAAVTLVAARTNVSRAILVAVCLMIGIVPLVATTMGIYIATIDEAAAVGGPKP